MIIRAYDFEPELDQARTFLKPAGLANDSHWLPLVFILMTTHGLKNRMIAAKYINLETRTFYADEFIKDVGWQLSSGESFMAQLALHLWNSQFKLNQGLEMLAGLDDRNYEIATLAIHLRYRGFKGTVYYEPDEFAPRRRVMTYDEKRAAHHDSH